MTRTYGRCTPSDIYFSARLYIKNIQPNRTRRFTAKLKAAQCALLYFLPSFTSMRYRKSGGNGAKRIRKRQSISRTCTVAYIVSVYTLYTGQQTNSCVHACSMPTSACAHPQRKTMAVCSLFLTFFQTK